jgi:hypothetical protein
LKRRCATPEAAPSEEPIRFADVLTTASAVADYRGQAMVVAGDLLTAIDMLRGKLTLEDLGRPVSPLVPRPSERGSEAAVRELVQRWWRELGEDVNATVEGEPLARLVAELRGIAD